MAKVNHLQFHTFKVVERVIVVNTGVNFLNVLLDGWLKIGGENDVLRGQCVKDVACFMYDLQEIQEFQADLVDAHHGHISQPNFSNISV